MPFQVQIEQVDRVGMDSRTKALLGWRTAADVTG